MATATAALLGGLSCTTSLTTTSASTGCVFRTSPGAVPAFCDTFDQPAGTGNRAGDLNGTVWGASRATTMDNNTQNLVYNWADASENQCGTTKTVQPERDIAICNGQVVEAVNDNTAYTMLGMYPKQPFDFAGRTGTVVFDVSDNSQGGHAAWPQFEITDQPIPAPDASPSQLLPNNPRNSVGFALNMVCGAGGCGGPNNPPGVNNAGFTCEGVGGIFTTSNYASQDIPFNTDGCVLPSTAVGSNNHFEVQISPSGMKIYGSDPGNPSATRLIADASFTLPLTRGLIWIEDGHYNGDKAPDTQGTNTFSWDNVGFDGPVLARDLAFDVHDSLTPGPPANNGLPSVNLGDVLPSGPQTLSLTVPGVTGLSNATAALLTLNANEYSASPSPTISYSLNGHAAHTVQCPTGGQTYCATNTQALPVPLSEVVSGNNTVTMSTSYSGGFDIANIDLILVGAGGVPAGPTPTPSPTATPAPSPTPAPVSITDVPCTVVMKGVSELGSCSGTFTPK